MFLSPGIRRMILDHLNRMPADDIKGMAREWATELSIQQLQALGAVIVVELEKRVTVSVGKL